MSIADARSLSANLEQQARKLLAAGIDPDAVSVALLDVAIKAALVNASPEDVQHWLRNTADVLPERLKSARPTH